MNGLFVAFFPPLSIFVCINLSQVEPRYFLHRGLALIVGRTLHANFLILQTTQSTLVEYAMKKEIKVDNTYLVTFLIRIPIFDWYVVYLGQPDNPPDLAMKRGYNSNCKEESLKV